MRTREHLDAVIKAYDVRGVVGEDIDENFVRDTGAAFAAILREEGENTVAVGHDMRPSSPSLARAFAEGVRYGEKKEKAEPEKLDREHEREGEERDAEGSAKRIERRIMNRFAAMDECAKTLGKVRANAYDSAESVYLAALRQEGVNTKGVSPQAARAAYRAFMAGKSRARKGSFAQDSASRQKSNLLVTKLSQIKKGY